MRTALTLPFRDLKAPRLRFHPGSVLRQLGTGDLFKIRAAYRTKDNPHEWIYVLDSGCVDRAPSPLARAVQSMAGSGMNGCVVCWEPLGAGQAMVIPGTENFYWHGDVLRIPTRRVLHEFETIEEVPA